LEYGPPLPLPFLVIEELNWFVNISLKQLALPRIIIAKYLRLDVGNGSQFGSM